MIVSVVTPTLNAIEFLEDCLQSVRRNAAPGLTVEHVIVDGGSTDGTLALAERYGARIMTGKDSGIFDAINKGSFAASGELLGFLGADDLLLDGALGCLAREYRRSKAGWLSGTLQWIDRNGKSLGTIAAPPAWMTPEVYACLRWSCVAHPATYVSRGLFEELGGFDITFKDAGDYDFFARAYVRARCQRLSQRIAAFRMTGANNSAVHPQRTANECQRVIDSYGPASLSQRQFNRYLLKVWLNARNPTWSAKKRITAWHQRRRTDGSTTQRPDVARAGCSENTTMPAGQPRSKTM